MGRASSMGFLVWPVTISESFVTSVQFEQISDPIIYRYIYYCIYLKLIMGLSLCPLNKI